MGRQSSLFGTAMTLRYHTIISRVKGVPLEITYP